MQCCFVRSLRYNHITTIEPQIFRGFPFLKYLLLSNNNISHIEANTFIGAPQLKSIKLLYNNLQTFDGYALNGTENRLRNIYLSRNSLRVIENGTFQLVPKLEVIDLYQNHLSQLTSGVFQELKNLERLFLGMNKLLDLPEDIFKDLSSLVYLDLSNNSLSSLTIDLFVHMDHLMTIDLSGNRLVLLIEANTFIGAPQLKSIKLLYNNLQTFDGYALNGTENRLRNIYLSRNSLRVIENGTFQLVPKLEVIDLYQNHLSQLTSGVFQELKNLERLFLGMNKLLDLPEDIFKDLSSLVYLDLSNNSLSSLTIDLFVHMDHLMTIDLSGNRLVAIGNVLNLPNIRLDLRWNSLRQLDNVTLEILTNNVEILFLEGNPWDCICGLEPLRQWYQQLSITNDEDVKIDNPICSNPNGLANHNISSLNFSFCEDIVAKSMETSTLNVIHDDGQNRNILMAADQMYQDVTRRTETSKIDGKLNVIIIVVAVVAFVVIIVIVSLIILRVVLLKRRSNDIKANKDSESNGRGNWGGGETSIQIETNEYESSKEEEEGDVNERTPLKRERNRGGIDLTPKERTCRKNLF
ncbi:leucine-rich repeat-containing protein 15-like [Strongylocentrotus purpuratus]|uniref:LRRCT domain-containing protein n=1 Tax=Strongylocentrotus purpuratus TaxID=7668 RepID=A0A7M7N2W3_STRPU|nr:leucine-rich repeat-containing protein 15-like [Strongylocentrotus purpuratus]